MSIGVTWISFAPFLVSDGMVGCCSMQVDEHKIDLSLIVRVDNE